jgi:hypothetical protein
MVCGDDEKTVREHYSRWVPERQARLTKVLKDAFDDKPKPKLLAMPGRRTESDNGHQVFAQSAHRML